MRIATVVTVIGTLLVAEGAPAQNVPLDTAKLSIKDSGPGRRALTLVSTDAAIAVGALTPQTAGAALHVFSDTDDFCVRLPAEGWTHTGTKLGYKDDVRNRVTAIAGKLKIKTKAGIDFSLDEPAQGAVEIALEFGDGPRWCMRCTSPAVDEPGAFRASDCDAPVSCATPPSTCTPESRRVFVSSTLSTAALLGLTGADATCNELASEAGLSGTYKAWLSTESASAASRLTHAAGPYVRVDGVTVADDWADLIDNSLDAPINIDEYGEQQPDQTAVWTGTHENGNSVECSPACGNCSQWFTQSAGVTGVAGFSHTTNGFWTTGDFFRNCAEEASLYCFEQ